MAHVTVQDITPRIDYSVGSATTSFVIPTTWGFFALTDFDVYSGTTQLTYSATPTSSTNFATSGIAVDGGYMGGNIVLGGSISTGTVSIIRDVPSVRDTDFPYPSATLNILTLNTQFDKLFAVMQQVIRDYDRTLQQPPSDTGTISALPVAASRASKALTFDANGNPTATAFADLPSSVTVPISIANGGSGSTSAADARTAYGLGTMATQAASAVAITGGTVTGITDLVVADGGTGASSFTDAGVLLGNGTGAIQVTTAGTAGQVLTSNGAGVDPTFQAVSSKLKQMVSTETGAVATGTTTVPNDDTIPQNSEGTEFMTLAVTPTSSTNKLVITVVFNFAYSASAAISVALFQDTTADALAAACGPYITLGTNTGQLHSVCFTHVMNAGTTSSTTFKVRAGGDNAGTMTFNGASGARKFGGVSASSIVIKEIEP